MNSGFARVNTIGSLALVLIGGCAMVMATISYLRIEHFAPPRPPGRMAIAQGRVGAAVVTHPLLHTATQLVEAAELLLDVDADFTSVFDWNTKQIFVFVVGEFATKEWPFNEVTLYDHIITSVDEARLVVRRHAEYHLAHIESRGLGGNGNVTLRLKYHVMTHSGLTHLRDIPEATLSFPLPPQGRQFRTEPLQPLPGFPDGSK
jgi:hypothetical protein